MARLKYADCNNAEIKPLAERIVAERGSILHLYQMLMHSSSIAEGWLGYLTAVRQKTSIPDSLREIMIIRVAILNNAPYEAEQHTPIALKAGVSPEQIDALHNWQVSDSFSAKETAILYYADAMTRDIQVPDAVFALIAQQFDEKEIVEITATIAAYNMVSRFLEALNIHSTDQREQGSAEV